MNRHQLSSKVVSVAEQDRIIAEMQAQQKNLLDKKNLPAPEPRAFNHSSRPLFVEGKDKVKPRPVVHVVDDEEDEEGFMSFSTRIRANFGGKCAVTGHDTALLLQAAMIDQSGVGGDSTSNGLLLDVSLRILFERGLMVINPDSLTVSFKCSHPLADQFDGVKLATPKVALNVEALRIHYNQHK